MPTKTRSATADAAAAVAKSATANTGAMASTGANRTGKETGSETKLRADPQRGRSVRSSAAPSIHGAREPLKSADTEAKRKSTGAIVKPVLDDGSSVPAEDSAASITGVASTTIRSAAAAKTPVSAKEQTRRPTKAGITDAGTVEAAPGKVAASAGIPVREAASASKAAAAAFVAARKKMAPAHAPASTGIPSDASKGTVQVTDKKVRATTLDAAAAPAASNPAPVAPAQPSGSAPMAARPFSAPPRGPAIRPRPAPGGKKESFKTGEFIVYPAHGVGQITATETQEVAGYKLELFVISFVKDKMILKVPMPKIVSVGMRKLAEPPLMKRALDTLTGRARIKRTMWSRRAQEYEAKINSGDLIAIAEVVRDLYRSDAQPEQSYSERQLYEAALDRMARELAAVQKLTDTEALKLIDDQLQKGPRRGKADEAEPDDGEEGDESGIGEAA